MDNSLKNREKSVRRLFYKILIKFLFFKIYAPLLPKSVKQKKLDKFHNKAANQIGNLFLELEGLFVKLAQQVSTMSNLLPKHYIEAFEKAQNHSNPRSFSEIEKRITRELGKPMGELFTSFDKKPLGVASIGQVHKAQLISGETVAVKVQHLNIDEIAKLDLQLIQKLLKIVQYFVKIPGFDGMFSEVVKMIHEELNYEHEAMQIQTISTNLSKDDRILIPEVFSELSTKKVLIMEYVHGEKITNKEFAQQHQINQEEVAKNLLDITSKTMFLDGVYHADPHPGNVLLNGHGQIVLLDFGAVGILSQNMKEGLIILMQAAILKDENLMISGLKKMGFIGNGPGVDKVCKRIIRLLGDFLVNELKVEKINVSEINLSEIDFSKVIGLIKDIDMKEVESVIQIPKDWVLLNRAVALTMGITAEIAPQVDVYKEVKPNLLKMAIQKENIGMILKNTLQQQLLRIISLPRKLELFLEQAENGEIEINLKNRKTEVKLIYNLIQQILFLIGSFGGYYFYVKTNEELLFYGSIASALLFIRGVILGQFLKRKLK